MSVAVTRHWVQTIPEPQLYWLFGTLLCQALDNWGYHDGNIDCIRSLFYIRLQTSGHGMQPAQTHGNPDSSLLFQPTTALLPTHSAEALSSFGPWTGP